MKPILRYFVLVALMIPAVCVSQKYLPKLQLGAGYVFYTGSATYGNINGDYAKNSLKSGFVGEATVTQQLNGFLHVGVGASFLKFGHTHSYVPLYAEIKVIGAGKYKLFSFLHPGYGFYKGSYENGSIGISPPDPVVTQKGGFYIAYGAGVMVNIFYLQATYHWLRFNTTTPDDHSSTGYGVAALTFGVRIP